MLQYTLWVWVCASMWMCWHLWISMVSCMGHAANTGHTRERLKAQLSWVLSIALTLESFLIVFRPYDAALNCILGAPQGGLPLWLECMPLSMFAKCGRSRRNHPFSLPGSHGYCARPWWQLIEHDFKGLYLVTFALCVWCWRKHLTREDLSWFIVSEGSFHGSRSYSRRCSHYCCSGSREHMIRSAAALSDTPLQGLQPPEIAPLAGKQPRKHGPMVQLHFKSKPCSI